VTAVSTPDLPLVPSGGCGDGCACSAEGGYGDYEVPEYMECGLDPALAQLLADAGLDPVEIEGIANVANEVELLETRGDHLALIRAAWNGVFAGGPFEMSFLAVVLTDAQQRICREPRQDLQLAVCGAYLRVRRSVRLGVRSSTAAGGARHQDNDGSDGPLADIRIH